MGKNFKETLRSGNQNVGTVIGQTVPETETASTGYTEERGLMGERALGDISETGYSHEQRHGVAGNLGGSEYTTETYSTGASKLGDQNRMAVVVDTDPAYAGEGTYAGEGYNTTDTTYETTGVAGKPHKKGFFNKLVTKVENAVGIHPHSNATNATTSSTSTY
jgi:hypothetical protein